MSSESNDIKVEFSYVGTYRKPCVIVTFFSADAVVARLNVYRMQGVLVVPDCGVHSGVTVLDLVIRCHNRMRKLGASVVDRSGGELQLKPLLGSTAFEELMESMRQASAPATVKRQRDPLTPRAGASTPQDKPAWTRSKARSHLRPSSTEAPHATSQPRVVADLPETKRSPMPAPAAAPSGEPSGVRSAARTSLPFAMDAPARIPAEPLPARDVGAFRQSAIAPGADGPLRFLASVPTSQEPLAEGRAKGNLAVMLLLAVSSGADGATLLAAESEGTGQRWYLFADGGDVVRAYQMPLAQQNALTSLLVTQGHISPAQAKKVVQAAESEGIAEEEAIRRMKLLPHDFLGKAVRAKVGLLTEALKREAMVRFDMRTFSVRWFERTTGSLLPVAGETHRQPSSGRIRIQLKDLVETLKQTPWDKMKSTQDDYLAKCPVLTRPEAAMHNLQMGKKERRFLEVCLDGSRTLREVYKITNLKRKDTFAVVFALHQLGYISFTEPPSHDQRRDELESVIEERHALIGKVDHFEFLDLHWSATEEDVSEAMELWEQQLSDAAPERVGQQKADKAREILTKIRSLGAWLGQRENRMMYRRSIVEPFAIAQAVKLQLGQLDMAIYRKDKEEIERLLTRITELDSRAVAHKRTAAMNVLSESDS